MYVDFNCPTCGKITTGMEIEKYFQDYNEAESTITEITEILCLECHCCKQFRFKYKVTLEQIDCEEEIMFKGEKQND